MAKVAICDHSTGGYVKNLKSTLVNKYDVEQFYDLDPAQVFEKLVAFEPDVVILDLYRESVDKDNPADTWWGIEILKLIRSNAGMADTIVTVGTKFLSDDVARLLRELGVSDKNRFKPLSTSPKQIADMIDALIAQVPAP